MTNSLFVKSIVLRSASLLRLALFALLVGLSIPINVSLAQQAPRFWDPANADPHYQDRKQQLTQTSAQPAAGTKAAAYTKVRPSCFEPYDTTAGGGWTQVPRNDDGSVGPVALGFDFSLFGTVYNTVFVNNNGNITFDSQLSAYTPGGFPISTPMVAAFWSDVDTRNPISGSVWYKVFPDRLVVTYSYVGYFPSRADRLSTFQLTIKANTAPGFVGNDVIFAYDDMAWTTGGASGGVGGFGGAPATVGVNRGNGVDFIQTGRFNINSNQPPNVPNTGDPGGVDWLDGLCLGYRVGGPSGNVPPAVAGLPANNTIVLDQGQTVMIPFQFSGPETNQNVNITTSLGGLCSATATVTSNDTPNPTVTFSATGSTCNVGTNTVTFTATDNGTPVASQTFTLTVIVNPAVGMNTPPTVVTAIPNQTATVGQAYSYTIPPGSFTDAETPNSLVLSASNLPPGLSLSGGVVSGTPSTTTGSPFSVTMTATDPGQLSVGSTFLFTILPGAVIPQPTGCGSPTATIGQPLQLLAPTYVCNGNGSITFNVIGGDGSPIEYQGIPGVSVNGQGGWNASCIQLVDAELRTAGDAPVMVLQARQNGMVVTYNWDIRAVCPVNRPGPENQSPGIVYPIPDQTATVGQAFNYTLPANTFIDPDGDPMTYTATGLPMGLSFAVQTISGTPAVSGTYSVTITATDGSILSGFDVFTLTVNPAGEMPVGFAITGVTLSGCNVVSSSERQLSFTPQYSGLNGQAVTFSVVNESVPTTAPGPYALRLYTDNPTITLKAMQGGTMGEVMFAYNWLAACGGSARIGVEPSAGLIVKVLGNPVLTETADVEIRGAAGQPLYLQMLDGKGHSLHELTIKQAGAVERATLRLGHSAGMYFLKATTGRQKQVVKIVKQ